MPLESGWGMGTAEDVTEHVGDMAGKVNRQTKGTEHRTD